MGVTVGGDQLLTQQMTFNAQMPPEGPLAIPAVLHFELGATINVDFTLQMERKTITAIQGIMVRNWFNADPITISIQGTQEYIDVPAFCDAFLQIATTNRAKLTFTSSGALAVPVLFFNVPISPLIIYSPSGGQPVIIGGTVDVDVVNTVTVTGTVDIVQGQAGTLIASATSITTGGTPVAVFTNPTVPTRIVNPNTATEPLFVDCIGNAGTVEAGGTFALNPGNGATFPALTGTITANAVTNGHTFSAWGPASGGFPS
jgi:hypothetical protein